jgi:hypothetical protein
MIRVCPMNVCMRNLRQKAERGKFTGSESTTRFPQASSFEKPTRSVPETWGHMYNVPACSAKGTKNGTRNWIPVQLRKGTKKLVSSNFAKILEYRNIRGFINWRRQKFSQFYLNYQYILLCSVPKSLIVLMFFCALTD